MRNGVCLLVLHQQWSHLDLPCHVPYCVTVLSQPVSTSLKCGIILIRIACHSACCSTWDAVGAQNTLLPSQWLSMNQEVMVLFPVRTYALVAGSIPSVGHAADQ